MIHASVKSYRSALFAFRINILNSIPVLLKGQLPMSRIPMESLLAILDSVSLWQSKAEDHLTLAIPASDLLSYYVSRLLADAIPVSEGLLLFYRLLRSKLFLYLLKQNLFRCLFRTTLRQLVQRISKLHI